jgi:hypothetical protein
MKRSLEIILNNWDAGDRAAVSGALKDAGIEVFEARQNFVQARNTTPTEIRRLCKGIKIKSIKEGFSR